MDMKWIAYVHDIAWTAADGTPLGGFAYTYDVVGRITARRHALGTNRFDRAYAYDDLDRLAADGPVSYAYDAAGNRTAKEGDVEGAVAYTRGYAYDALGRRASTTTWEGTVRHVYDDNWQVIADLDSNGNVLRSYVWGEEIDRLLAVKVGAKSYAALTDVQGTVWGLADGTDVVARWMYDAWGNVLSGEASDPALAAFRYRFQGREFSAVTGLTNFRMRWYDPGTGRWLSKDPIRVVGGMNLHSFVLNKPINCNDFDGMDIHYTSEGGGHSVIWVDKPGSDVNRTISFEFGPLSGNIFWGESVVITSEECGHHGSKTIKTTVEQDEKAIQKINEIKNKKPKYNILFNNCADLVRDILDAAGIDLPWRLIDTPTKLENDLKNK